MKLFWRGRKSESKDEPSAPTPNDGATSANLNPVEGTDATVSEDAEVAEQPSTAADTETAAADAQADARDATPDSVTDGAGSASGDTVAESATPLTMTATTAAAASSADTTTAPAADDPSVEMAAEQTDAATPFEEESNKPGLYARLKRGLSRTGNQLASGLGNLFLGKKVIDDELLEELEAQLLMSDVGIDATQRVIDDITARVSRKELSDGDAVMQATQAALMEIIKPCEQPLDITGHSPFVILVVGVNGAGKTTTIGKLAHRYKAEGRKVMLAAGDTFRAAAVEQLQAWGERNDVPVIAQHTGADSASVLFDALQAAKARGADVLIADTAGRLQNKAHLMDELEKVVRVMRKLDPSAPHETLLVLDAGTGQNAVSQAEQFDRAVGVSGIVLTKLDGTARGGVIFAIAQKLRRPIRFIGVGESAEDLRPFDATAFSQALFDRSGE